MVYRALRKLTPPGMHYQSMVFFLRDLQDGIRTSVRSPEGVNMLVIAARDDPWLRMLDALFPAKAFPARMGSGAQQCYVAVGNERLLGYAWVTTSPCQVSEIGFLLSVPQGAVYIYDCYVMPDSRGRGLYQALLQQILVDYRRPRRPRRFRAACIAAEPGNAASIRGIRRAGFQAVAQAHYVQVGHVSRCYGVDALTERLAALSG